jgi:hypothetical protein
MTSGKPRRKGRKSIGAKHNMKKKSKCKMMIMEGNADGTCIFRFEVLQRENERKNEKVP